MKTIVLGDTHGRTFWKYVVNTQTFDRLIFLGDYFDSFDISSEDQQNNFLDIVAYKERYPDKVNLLIGNHDYHYLYGGDGSGYQVHAAVAISYLIKEHIQQLEMACYQDEILFTHAGVGEYWLEKNWEKVHQNDEYPDSAEFIAEFVNDMWKYRPGAFEFSENGRDTYGDDMSQTPIWIRPKSLQRGNINLKKKIIQVVGHTRVQNIDIQGKATGGRYYFIDAMGSSKEYLIIEDGQFKTNKV